MTTATIEAPSPDGVLRPLTTFRGARASSVPTTRLEEVRRRAVQTEMVVDETAASDALPWPKDAPSQFIMLRGALARGPASVQDMSRRFKGAPRGARMAEMLATLAALGQARTIGDGRYAA